MLHKPETISLDKLRRLACSHGRIKLAARDALRRAEVLEKERILSSIVIDRHLRTIQVYNIWGDVKD